MRPKFLVIAIIAFAAYVFGAPAGRERYDQMKGAIASFWNDPTVKQARKDAYREAQKARKTVQRAARQRR